MRTRQSSSNNKENIKNQTYTPKKKFNSIQLSSKKDIDMTSIKDFLPPILENIIISLQSSNNNNITPLKKQPEYLLSPSPIKKDLFSQLLGSERRGHSPNNLNQHGSYNNMIMQEQDYEYIDEQSNNHQNDDSQSDEDDDDSENMYEDENGIKKRKRKSTAQIKILKQELDGEMNWTKQKIVKMAQITGLSQSQVYKWCWDQKKKNLKNKDQMHKRKFIRKDYSTRHEQTNKQDNYEIQANNGKILGQYELPERQVRTKPKLISMLDQGELGMTEKKVNKKLVFN